MTGIYFTQRYISFNKTKNLLNIFCILHCAAHRAMLIYVTANIILHRKSSKQNPNKKNMSKLLKVRLCSFGLHLQI